MTNIPTDSEKSKLRVAADRHSRPSAALFALAKQMARIKAEAHFAEECRASELEKQQKDIK